MKLAVLIVLVVVQVARAEECGPAGIATADECAYKAAFLTNRNLKVPKTMDEIKAHCGIAMDSMGCLISMNDKCVTGPPQLFMKKLFGSIKQSISDRCDDPENLQEFLDNLQCLDTDAKVEAVRKCSDKHIVILEAVSNFKPEARSGALCCAFQGHQDCLEKVVREQCGDSQANYFKSLVAENADEIAFRQCDNFNTLAKCGSNLPADQWTTLSPLFDADPADARFKHSYKSPVPILVKMLDKFYKS